MSEWDYHHTYDQIISGQSYAWYHHNTWYAFWDHRVGLPDQRWEFYKVEYIDDNGNEYQIYDPDKIVAFREGVRVEFVYKVYTNYTPGYQWGQCGIWL